MTEYTCSDPDQARKDIADILKNLQETKEQYPDSEFLLTLEEKVKKLQRDLEGL